MSDHLPQLFHNVLHVDLDGFFGEEVLLGDIAIPIPGGDLLETSISRALALLLLP